MRELLIAQRRKVHEVWIAADLEGTDAIDDIVALAAANRVPLSYVGRTKLEASARSEAPQGVLARASAPSPKPTSRRCSAAVKDGRRSSSPSTASPTPATSAPSSAGATAPASTV